MSKPSTTAVIVIGGGPAGLMAAIRAAEQGATVTLCERLPQPGRRLLGGAYVSMRLNLMSDMTAPQWTGRLVEWQRKHGRRTVRNMLGQHMPRKLAAIACREAGIDPFLTATRLPRSSRNQLAAWLTGAPLTITGTDGLDRAMVTSGGISLKQVNPANLESRLVPGLFFAGEILDLDGPCGGFNLQWAFSSGRLAGMSAASSPHSPSCEANAVS